MSYKPSEFSVGVVDLFAVLVPGAIVVAIGRGWLTAQLPPEVASLIDGSGGAGGWIAFAIASFVAGHMVFLLGMLLDSPLYDPLRKRFAGDLPGGAYESAKRLRDQAMRGEGLRDDINPFQWARAVLRLRAPAAFTDVERYEAHSKLFRGLTVTLFVLLLIVLCRDALHARESDVRALSGGAAGAVVLLLSCAVVADVRRRARTRQARLAAKREQRAAQAIEPARWLVPALAALALLALVLVAGRAWVGRSAMPPDVLPLALFVLLALAVWGYADQRFRSHRAAYRYVALLDTLPAAADAGADGAPTDD